MIVPLGGCLAAHALPFKVRELAVRLVSAPLIVGPQMPIGDLRSFRICHRCLRWIRRDLMLDERGEPLELAAHRLDETALIHDEDEPAHQPEMFEEIPDMRIALAL